MIVIGHQTVGVAGPAITRDYVSERIEKQLAIVVVEKDLLVGASSAGQMINRAREF
jgi:hypothetical protein